jgi:hypothetical protein
MNIRPHRIMTKIYGGANARVLLFRLLIPPGKNVLGYRKKNQKKSSYILFFNSNQILERSMTLYNNYCIIKISLQNMINLFFSHLYLFIHSLLFLYDRASMYANVSTRIYECILMTCMHGNTFRC